MGPATNTRLLLCAVLCLSASLYLEYHFDVPHELYSDLLCWVVLSTAAALLGFSLRSQKTVDPSSEKPGDDGLVIWAVAAAIVISSVCRKQSAVTWVLPMVGLVLTLRQPKPISSPTSNGTSLLYSSSSRPGAIYHSILAILSSLALCPAIPSFRSLILSLCFFVSQWATYSGGYDSDKDSGESFWTRKKNNSVITARSIAFRALSISAIFCFVLPPPEAFDPLLVIGNALIKSLWWTGAFILLQDSSPSVAPAILTFSVASSNATIPADVTLWSLQPLGVMLAGLYSLGQVVGTFPSSLRIRSILWVFLLFPLGHLALLKSGKISNADVSSWTPKLPWNDSILKHPIEVLIDNAKKHQANIVESQSKTLFEAVSEYKNRYGRPPPRGFDSWYNIAKDQGLVIFDDHDLVTKSLEPYWSVAPKVLRASINAVMEKHEWIRDITISEGQLNTTDTFPLFGEIKKQLSPYLAILPDLPAPILVNRLGDHDLARVVLPYDIQEMLKRRQQTHKVGKGPYSQPEGFHWVDLKEKYSWDTQSLACPPDGPSRWHTTYSSESDELDFLSDPERFKDICSQPELRYQHGAFMPLNNFITHTPIPIFSGAKLSLNSDVLFPSPYYAGDRLVSPEVTGTTWESKKNLLYWSGSTTGLHANPGVNWHLGHRHRFVEFVQDLGEEKRNATLLKKDSGGRYVPYQVPMASQTHLFNASFTRVLQCDKGSGQCEAQEKFYNPWPRDSRLATYEYRYLIDIDGNGFSGRFYRLLESNATVLKQTIFQEWHDEQLIPWVHYVPVSMGMQELPEIMRYFTETAEGEAKAKEIAQQGSEWARRALRREDTGAIFARMVLEYARLISDDREQMNFDVK